MATDMGRGIIAPERTDLISASGVDEMRTLGVTTAHAMDDAEGEAKSYTDERVRDAVVNVVFTPHDYIPDNSIAALVDELHSGFDFGQSTEEFAYFGESGEWLTNESSETFPNGGQVSYPGSERATALWSRHGDFDDGEVLVRANISELRLASNGGAVIRAATDAQGGYMAAVRGTESSPRIVLIRYEATFSEILDQHAVTLAVDTPYYVRLRAEGSTMQAKYWLATEPEPVEWMVSADDNTYSSGGAGCGKLSGSRARWNYISVNRMGGSA